MTSCISLILSWLFSDDAGNFTQPKESHILSQRDKLTAFKRNWPADNAIWIPPLWATFPQLDMQSHLYSTNMARQWLFVLVHDATLIPCSWVAIFQVFTHLSIHLKLVLRTWGVFGSTLGVSFSETYSEYQGNDKVCLHVFGCDRVVEQQGIGLLWTMIPYWVLSFLRASSLKLLHNVMIDLKFLGSRNWCHAQNLI